MPCISSVSPCGGWSGGPLLLLELEDELLLLEELDDELPVCVGGPLELECPLEPGSGEPKESELIVQGILNFVGIRPQCGSFVQDNSERILEDGQNHLCVNAEGEENTGDWREVFIGMVRSS